MKLVSPPNPQWNPGDRVHSPVTDMVSLDPQTLDTAAIYKLLIGSIVPRPIAFVTTVNENGTINAAPFSFFNGVSSNPPAVMISIGFRPDGEKKDTLRNIEVTEEFVVNTVGEWMTEPMNYASAEYPYGVSEVEAVGLTTVASKIVAPPRIKESPVHFECRLHSLLQIGKQEAGASTMVVGEIVHFHIHRPALRDGRIDAEQLEPIARLGGLQYGCMDRVFELPRPSFGPSHRSKGTA